MLGSALKVPLFYGLDEGRMAKLLARATPVAFGAGETIIEAGEFGDCAMMVISGHATEYNAFSPLHPYTSIGPGALIAEMAMLIETQHHHSVIADSALKVLQFTRSDIEDLMGDDPVLADHFVQSIAGRLNNLAKEMRAYEADYNRDNPSPLDRYGSNLDIDFNPGADSDPWTTPDDPYAQ